MIASFPVLSCVLSSDSGVYSGKTPDKASLPIAKALKVPAVLMVGEYIDIILKQNIIVIAECHDAIAYFTMLGWCEEGLLDESNRKALGTKLFGSIFSIGLLHRQKAFDF